MAACKCKNELVSRLCAGDHVVSFEDRTLEPACVDERIKDGFVFVKFAQTRGGTELGINLRLLTSKNELVKVRDVEIQQVKRL